jgi:3(or 17)beta-hydroxysteroid dehydrogenase
VTERWRLGVRVIYRASAGLLEQGLGRRGCVRRLVFEFNGVLTDVLTEILWNKAMKEIAQTRGVSFDHIVTEWKATVPLGDFTLAEDVAAAVAFLTSEDARHVTGSSLIVDGGLVHCNTYRAGSKSESADRQDP